METLDNIKKLVEEMSIDTGKVFNKHNRSASIRARKYAQRIKLLLGYFRKEILEEIKTHEKKKKI